MPHRWHLPLKETGVTLESGAKGDPGGGNVAPGWPGQRREIMKVDIQCGGFVSSGHWAVFLNGRWTCRLGAPMGA